MKIKRSIILKLIRIIVYILIIISMVILKYTDIINVKCYIQENLGVLCPTCGITRAIKDILNFDIINAIKHNAYVTIILFPTFCVLFIDDIICMLSGKKSFVDIILGE